MSLAPGRAPEWLRHRGEIWLHQQGYLRHVGTGQALSQDGRDWLLWAIWNGVGCPGMPFDLYEKETDDR